jgi:septum formation protein
MYKTKKDLILASASPRRRELLSRMGIKFSVMPSNFEEETEMACPERDPELHCQNCSREKAERVARLISDQKEFWFLGLDTIVVIDDLIMGKPRDKDQARDFLTRLAGRWHRVITGYHIFHRPGGERISRSVESKVLIKKLSEREIEAYVSTKEPYDKAGAYAAQGIGAGLIEEIQGSYTNVVGLPLAEMINELLRLGVIEPNPGD